MNILVIFLQQSAQVKQTTQQPQEVLASVFRLPVVLSDAIIDLAQVYHCA